MRRKTKRILIDSDIIAFKAASAAEVPIKWDDDMWTLHASESTVKQIVDTIVARIVLHTGIKKLVICAGSKENFRKQILPSYKHHRVETRKPMLLVFAKEYLETLGEVKRIPNTETDDVIGILATSESKYDDHIWSEDKDLLTIPGKHIDKNTFEIVTVTEHEANYKWMMQTLTGDTTDGYKGCPGSGQKDAEKTLAACETLEAMWEAVVKRYEKAGLTEHDALQQTRCARILRAEDYGEEYMTIKYWKPEKFINDTTDTNDRMLRMPAICLEKYEASRKGKRKGDTLDLFAEDF